MPQRPFLENGSDAPFSAIRSADEPQSCPRSEELNDQPDGGDRPAPAHSEFGAGIDDAVILPLVLIAFAARKLFHVLLTILIHILDYAFPILLQLARFPLFTVRIIGDGVVVLLKGIVGCLPVAGTTRDAWRERVGRYWSWLRQKISYKAFEDALHRAFEGGMAWVFRTCRRLTPRGALLVIAGAVLWLPVSFGAATAIHAVLIAKVAVLPPWMQLLHPLATILAKSKLLVLPVYPAAWPQAKKYPFVQALFRFYRYVAALYLMQKTRYRYRQTERAYADGAVVLEHVADRVGLSHLLGSLVPGFNSVMAAIGRAVQGAATRTVAAASGFPLIGTIVRSYSAHYDGVSAAHAEKFSKQAGGLFARWSIKFSAEYYEAKEREEAAKRHALQIATVHPPALGHPSAGG
jgi:hypothetical protein